MENAVVGKTKKCSNSRTSEHRFPAPSSHFEAEAVLHGSHNTILRQARKAGDARIHRRKDEERKTEDALDGQHQERDEDENDGDLRRNPKTEQNGVVSSKWWLEVVRDLTTTGNR